MSCVCLASWLSCVAKTLMLDITWLLFIQIVSYLLWPQAPFTSVILYHFYWPLPCTGVTRSVQNRIPWLNFLTYFTTDQDGIWYGVDTILFLSEDLMKQRKWLLFYWPHQKISMVACIQRFLDHFDANLSWWFTYKWTPLYLHALVNVSPVLFLLMLAARKRAITPSLPSVCPPLLKSLMPVSTSWLVFLRTQCVSDGCHFFISMINSWIWIINCVRQSIWPSVHPSISVCLPQ